MRASSASPPAAPASSSRSAACFGITIGWVEGVEVNVLGLVTGVDIRRPALKLPGFGRIGVGTVA